jgi:hypothetical protein
LQYLLLQIGVLTVLNPFFPHSHNFSIYSTHRHGSILQLKTSAGNFQYVNFKTITNKYVLMPQETKKKEGMQMQSQMILQKKL